MDKLKVGVIFGGKSSEKEISLATGRYVFNLLDVTRFSGVPLYMDSQGRIWEIPIKLVLLNTTKDVEERLKKDAKRINFEDLKQKVDFIFIALLGKYGEDGAIQGLLELLKIPYSGSGILASAAAMHKRFHKDLIKAQGISVAKDERIQRQYYSKHKKEIADRIKDKLGYPVVVKPVAEGSSVGVSYVNNPVELHKAAEAAFVWDSEILIEEYLQGKEFMCVLLGNEDPVAMQPSEVEFTGKIFTYENKYMPGKARYFTPIRTTDQNIKNIQEIAVRVYKLIGIKGYGRVDGFLLGDKVYISEPHTGTIMVPSSYVFQQASLQNYVIKGKGGLKADSRLNPRNLIATIIDLGLEAHAEKKGTL